MMSSFWRRTAITLTGSALAVAGAMMPAQAAPAAPAWRTAAVIGPRGNETLLTTIHAVSPADAWAAGASGPAKASSPAGLIERWTGKSWKAVALPSRVSKAWKKAGFSFSVVGASSSTNVWVFNEFSNGATPDTYIRLAGRNWSTGTLPGTSVSSGNFVAITSVEVFGKAGVWVFGGKITVSASQPNPAFKPYIAHFNGHGWTTVKNVPGSGEITDVSAISPANMWAVVGVNSLGGAISGASKPAVLHWNGSQWKAATAQPALPAGANLTAVTAAAGNKVWVGGDVRTKAGGTVQDFVAAYSGTTWSAAVSLPRSGATAAASGRQPYEIESLVQDGKGGLWALAGNLAPANPRLWHYAGTWSLPASPSFGNSHRALLQLAAVPGAPGSVWGAGIVGNTSVAKGLIAITGPTPR